MWLKNHNKTKLIYSNHIYSVGATKRGETFWLNMYRNNDFMEVLWENICQMMLHVRLKLFFSIVMRPLLQLSSTEFNFEQHSSNMCSSVADGKKDSQVMTLSLSGSVFDFMFVF